eukprot:m.210701 g.210701  ORF g.210701 m.210701 type:complete len:260 (+) comp19017_c0_seq1:272-1051(+)
MAFRRLTSAQRFAIKGAVTYSPRLVNPAAIGDPKLCPWGFVPQNRLRDILVNPTVRGRQEIRVNLSSNGEFIEPYGILSDFQRLDIDFSEFSNGVGIAYQNVASLFSDASTDFRNVELVSPRLSLFLNNCLSTMDEKGHTHPTVLVDTVEPLVQELAVEFGNVDQNNKWFGVYDTEEIKFHLLGGFLPEVTTANELQGNHPQRIVASVLYKAKEKFWCAGSSEEPETWSDNIHYVEYESPAKGEITWRIRNFNKCIYTP